MSGNLKAMGRAIASGLLVVVLGLVLLELVLQVAALFSGDRAGAWRADATHRVLCVGDSHTWGGGVEREEAYPAHLQSLLDDRTEASHSVINLGLPGMNTEQLRERLPVWLSRYRPDVVVVWVGVNNQWNVAEVDATQSLSRAWLEGFAIRLRSYRLLRVWLHDRQLKRYVVRRDSDRAYEISSFPPRDEPEGTFVVRHDGVIEQIRHRLGPESAGEEQKLQQAEARAERDFRAIVEIADAAGVDLAFITYPIDSPLFEMPNRAVRRVTTEFSLPFVESRTAVERIPEDEREWLWAAHPSGPMYREIARDLVPVVIDFTEETRDAR